MAIGYIIIRYEQIKKVVMAKIEKEKAINLFENVLQSKYLAVISLLFGFLCWALEWTALVVCGEALIFILILLFSKDVKNIFAPFFFISFFIPDIRTMTNYLVYYIAVGLALLTLIGVFIYKCVKDRKTITFGRFYKGLLASFVVYLIAGIFNSFYIVNSLMILGFCVGIFIFYFLAVNYTKNISEYFEELFILSGIIIGLQIFFNYVINGPGSIYFSAQGLNTASLFVVLGIIACFTRAMKSKRDYIYFIIVLVLTVFVVVSKSRAGMILTAVVDVAFTIYTFIKSKNKTYMLLVFGAFLLIIAIMLLASEFLREEIQKLVFGKKFGFSGREELWAWSIDRFLEAPIFGYGFFYMDKIPSLREGTHVILTHNTPLQWLTSAGIIGTLIMVVYYLNKYTILFKKFNREKLFALLSVLALELSGLVDQAANMDIFVVSISIMLVASVERK